MLTYVITNQVNGKIYVGKTEQSLEKRWSDHIKSAKYSVQKYALMQAIRKYKSENFCIQELSKASSLSELENLEKVWIILLRSTYPKIGYNMTYGGEGGRQTEEVRKRMSAAMIGKHVCWKKGKKMGPLSEEQKRHLSQINSGKILSVEHKQAISLGGKGKHAGEKNQMAKLTNKDVIEFRASHASGVSLKDLAEKYHIHYQTAYKIGKGLRWVGV